MYEVEIRTTKMPIPLNMFVHVYFSVLEGSEVNRYDCIGILKNIKSDYSNGHIYRNILPLKVGLRIWPGLDSGINHCRYDSKKIYTCEGESGSFAHHLTRVITTSIEDYPFIEQYNALWGPNSNTYAQWVIDQVPNAGIKLPWNAWGKGFRFLKSKQTTPGT